MSVGSSRIKTGHRKFIYIRVPEGLKIEVGSEDGTCNKD